MPSSVSSSRLWDRQNATMYYVAPTVTNEYMVHGSNLLDLRNAENVGVKVVTGTVTTPMTFGVGVSTASAATTYTIVRTAITTSGTAQTSNQLQVDVDELAHLGAGFRYAAVYVSATATAAGHIAGVFVTRANSKRDFSGLTAAQTTSVAAVTGSGS